MRKNIQAWSSPVSRQHQIIMLSCLRFHRTALTELHHSHWKLTWYKRGVGDFCFCLRHIYGFQASNTEIYQIFEIASTDWERAGRKYFQGTEFQYWYHSNHICFSDGGWLSNSKKGTRFQNIISSWSFSFLSSVVCVQCARIVTGT